MEPHATWEDRGPSPGLTAFFGSWAALVHSGFRQDSSPWLSVGGRYWVSVVSWACSGGSEASHRPDQTLERIVLL